MLPIVWAADAENDLAEIISFVGQRNQFAAEKLWGLLHDSVLPLSDHPYLYRKSERVPGTREIVAHPNLGTPS
jgi:plasmid stabilization system protein ParE